MENSPVPINKNYQENEKALDTSLNKQDSKIKKDNIPNILNNNDLNFDDSSSQDNIDENDIINNIKSRFDENIFFTNLKNKLLYLNPFCNEEEIFGNDMKYLLRLNNNEIENGINIDAHLFKNINKAILELKKNNFNKYAILLQGDSYSGKSKIINESIKYIINILKTNNETLTETNNALNIILDNNYNSSSSNKQNKTMSFDDGFYSIDNNKYNLINIPKKILASLTILEAFENVKNDINDNSTRSINYIKLRLNKKCNKILGMEIFPFLFDKNRVSNSEKYNGCNYNIFYYLLHCDDSDLLNKLFLSPQNINFYNYLKRNENLIDNEEISYNEIKFNELKEALNIVGFNNEEILTIFKILSSIILLGNVELNLENNSEINLNQNEILLNVCKLLNIDINEFLSALVNQETFKFNIYNESEEIEQTKNNFVNELYNQLFLWIITKINNNINNNIISENDKDKFIIFLDFPGFEYDQMNFNFLEQLYINYINEFVLYFYIKDLSNDDMDKDLINKKDILKSIDYLLKDIKIMQNEKQMKLFISNFIKDIKLGNKSKHKYAKIRGGESPLINSSVQKCFIIKHSVGDILYNIKDILIKNIKNFIPWNLLDCLLKSNDPKIRNIYKNKRKNIFSNNASNVDNKSNFNIYSYNYENIFNNSYITLGEEFINYIKEIKKEIKQSQRNYIICLKSNPNDDPLEFNTDFIIKKLIFYKISPYSTLSQQIENKKESKEEKDKKISIIQSGIKTFLGKNKINKLNDMLFFIQNSLRILIAKNKLDNIKTKKQFLLVQLKLFLRKIKIKEIQINRNNNSENENGIGINNLQININNEENNLMKNNNKKIIFEKNINQKEEEKNQEEQIKLNKISKEKDKRLSIINQAQSNILVQKMKNKLKLKNNTNQIKKINPVINIRDQIINILQQKLFLKKIEQKKICTKKIINCAYASLYSKYYILLRKEIKVIQKYFKRYIISQKILDNAFDNYMKKKYTKSKNDLWKKINDVLFPYRSENLDESENMKSLEKKNELNKNKNIEEKKIKNKIIMTTSERYKEYKKKNQFYNFKINNQLNNINNENNSNQQIHTRNIKDRKGKNFIETYQISKDILIKNIPNLSNTQFSYRNLNNPKQHFENKIYILSKIIDMDILSDIPDEEQINELLWVQEYKKIYEFNLKNKTPIQQIFLSDTHTLLINNLGKFFLFGANDDVQCGLKVKNSNENNYISADDFLKNYKINDIYENAKEAVLKDDYSLILNKKGKTFSLNENYINDGKFGELNTSTYNNENSQINNIIIQSKIQSIQGSGNINLYLTKSKEVYLDLSLKQKGINSISNINQSYNQLNIVKLFLPNKVKISSISCGFNFYILLSTLGKLYSGGSNTCSELCSKTYVKQRISPEEIYDVSNLNEKIIQVSCGFKHVVILSEKNKVYGWGNNSFCQLYSPKKKKANLVKLNCDKKILQISAGFRSTFLLDDKNEIYFFGILNKDRKNTTNKMEKIYIGEKNNEFGNKNEFIPVKINAKWNKLFSILYVHFADIRNISVKIEDQNQKYKLDKIKYIINIIASKWLINSIKLPYMKEINQYFDENFMEKPDKMKQEIFY